MPQSTKSSRYYFMELKLVHMCMSKSFEPFSLWNLDPFNAALSLSKFIAFIVHVVSTMILIPLGMLSILMFSKVPFLFPDSVALSLHFADSFQGCSKDGTEPAMCDLCWLSPYGLVLRFCVGILFVITLSPLHFVNPRC